MKWLMEKIDLFCYRHPRFGIPNLMLYVVIANAVVWVLSLMDTSHLLLSGLYFNPEQILRHGQVWRLISFIFVPENMGYTALLFLYFYYFIGSTLERQWGPGKFTIYFFTGIVLTELFGFILYFVTGRSYSIDAQFAYMSMYFTFATLYSETQVLFMFFIPIKMKWLGIANAVFYVYSMLTMPFPVNLLPLVGVANYLLFCGDALFRAVKPAPRQQRQRRQTFQSEIRRIRYEEAHKPYNRRCEVCGRTDVSDPELEFRYCSRCQGYHCYCIDHINNHTHVQ